MKRIAKKSLGAVFGVVIILLFMRTLFNNWNQIQDFQFDIKIPYYLLSTFVLILIVFYWSVVWNLLLRDLNCKKLSFFDSFKIQLQAWFGRYLPGKIGVIGIKLYLGKDKGVDTATTGISVVYEYLFQILTAALISVPILFYFSSKELRENPFLYQVFPILFIVCLFIFIHPRVFFYVVNLGLKISKKQPISKEYFLATGQIIKYMLLYSVGVVANGLAFFMFIQSITNLPLEYLLPVIGIFNFAGLIGTLAIFVPAGLGVREGVIILFLQAYLPLEIVILISVLSRLWSTIADLIIGIYIVTFKKVWTGINK